jgi:hypothetical protein
VTPFICKTCGVQHAPSQDPPPLCLICNDDRQYIGWEGQQWTTLDEMQTAGHTNRFAEVDGEPGLWSIFTRPRFAIGQRALLVQTPAGNFLWDSISHLDEETVSTVRDLGGLAGLSASHPHFYGSIIEWSHAFDGAPVYLPRADEQWIARPDSVVELYEDSVEPIPGVTLIQCGGHFDGSAALHWSAAAAGRGALLTGDTISVVADRRWVTFMRSYPNYIPLSAAAVGAILKAVGPYSFDRIYGGWWQNDVRERAREALDRSAQRYIQWVTGLAQTP